MKRKLIITLRPAWVSGLRAAAATVKEGIESGEYQGETLDFETPGAFFGRMTELRWTLVCTLQDAGQEVGVRELARMVKRDVRRVHDDLVVLQELGLVERTEAGSVLCSFDDIHVDMHLGKAGEGGKRVGIAKGEFKVPDSIDANNAEVAHLFLGGQLNCRLEEE